ncbi:ABC-type dipeptide/oligopeptide/nickel transport system ATPase subunit [Paraburkholderia sp. GAS333]
MHPEQDFDRLYTDISVSIAGAIADIDELNVEHERGRQEIGNMLQRLRTIQSRFDLQLADLQQFAEWDKFTLAFFGETNAGKSTIIESLRILFKEESREQLLREQAYDVERFEQALKHHVEQVRQDMDGVCGDYAAEIADIRQSAAALAGVVKAESSARVRRKVWLGVLGGVVAGCALAVPLTLVLRGLL